MQSVRWVAERALGGVVENLAWVLLAASAVVFWQVGWPFGDSVTLPGWVAILAAGVVLVLLIATGRYWFRYKRVAREYAYLAIQYLEHLRDAMTAIESIGCGHIESVTRDVFTEQGLLEPARVLLVQGTGDDVRLAVLAEDGNVLKMRCGAGHNYVKKRKFAIPTIRAFASLALQSSEVEESADISKDPRFRPYPDGHPQDDYLSLICVPVRSGEENVAVLTVDSPLQAAFDDADYTYIVQLAGLVGLAWSHPGFLTDPQQPGLNDSGTLSPPGD